MKKFIASAIVGLLTLSAVPVFGQGNLAEIEKEVREQVMKLATMDLELAHFDVTQFADRAITAARAFARLEKKIQALAGDPVILCVQLPGMPYRQTLRDAETNAARVVEIITHRIPQLLDAGAVPSEGMRKLMANDLPQLMRMIATDSARLQSLFSDLETSCSKEG